MNFTFTPVTQENIDIFSKLHVAPSQLDMVETVRACYEEAQEYALWNPFAIACNGEYIGFTMYGEFTDPYRVWFDRFFIHEQHQGKGYAKAVVPIILQQMQREYHCKEIHLSVYPNNQPAISLYESVGFVFTGELDTKGEHVMVLSLSCFPASPKKFLIL